MISLFGKGFVGSEFCRLFNENDIKIEPRDSRTPSSNTIIYFISTTDNYNVLTDPTLDVKTNISALTEFLAGCRKVYEKTYKPAGKPFTINFISSFFVYGDHEDLPVTEETVCRPKGFYSITKRCAEELLVSYCQTFDLSYRILRLCNVYGFGDRFSSRKNALQFIFDNLLNNREVLLYNNGKVIRDFMHVEDVARALKLCVEKAPLNEIINIGSGNKYYFGDIVTFAKEYIKSESRLVSVEPPEFHKVVGIKNFYMDVSKLKALGFEPRIDIHEGVRRCLDEIRK